MRTTFLLAALSSFAAVAAGSDDQCFGYTPMPSVSTYLGAELQYSTAQRICCNNHRYAEYRGYLEAPEVDLFGKLDPEEETIFYDSVCGIPLFIAPRGRSFEEFKAESLKHGWPSFRPEELVSENVIIHDDGRMESRCLTHLGHNLPEGGVDRYCIDLVCMAGEPLSTGDERAKILTLIDESVLEHEELNSTEYVSSAEQYSGKTSNALPMIIVGVIVFASVAFGAAIYYYFGMRSASKEGSENSSRQWEEVDQESATLESGSGVGEGSIN
jgi:peptide methionine sulfoxide reductase MsrB